MENPRKGGGVSRVGGGGGRGVGRVFRGIGGGGLNIFFSAPKFPPSTGQLAGSLTGALTGHAPVGTNLWQSCLEISRFQENYF